MSYVPVEKVTGSIKNKYEAVVVAAREARHINTIMRMVGRDDARHKVTTRALSRVIRGDVDYLYIDEQTEQAVAERPQETPTNEPTEPRV
jgi:DNA-directed RNA polymerase omega subunit